MTAAESADLRVAIERRIAYGKTYRSDDSGARNGLRSGWSSAESGPCCDACRVDDMESNPLRVLASCRNPFQLPSICECHLPFRAVAEAAIQGALKNLLQITARA